MLKVYNCIAHAHDLRLVGLAALICTLASFTAINLLYHVRNSHGVMRRLWLGVSATATGFGIWATHFIAMLAFSPGIPSAYNIVLTVLSLVAAITLTGIGLAVALTSSRGLGPWLGGALVGGGIAAMHYTGMAAFEIQGRIIWDPLLVALSIALGAALGAVALPVGLRSDGLKWKLFGAGGCCHYSRPHYRNFRYGAARRIARCSGRRREFRHHPAGAGWRCPGNARSQARRT
jgi:diguanylate cyclase